MATTLTEQDITKMIERCDKIIKNQNDRKRKLEKKLAELKKAEILDAIINSGKTLEEVLELINK